MRSLFRFFSCFLVLSVASMGVKQLFAELPVFSPAAQVEQPTDWKSNESDNRVVDGSLQVASASPTSSLLSQKIAFESRKLYRYSFRFSQLDGVGKTCACCGTEFFNYDYSDLPIGETPTSKCSEVFFVPDDKNGTYEASARFAKWESERAYRFSFPEISPVQPLFKLIKNNKNVFLPLGSGEALDKDGIYRFACFNSPENSDYDRTLYSTTASFNTNRWAISKGDSIVYRLALESFDVSDGTLKLAELIPFSSGSIEVRVGYWVKGTLVVEGSPDGQTWTKLGEVNKVASETFSLESILRDKQSQVWIRFRGVEVSDNEPGCSLQIHDFSATLQTEQDESSQFQGAGETLFAEINHDDLDKTPTIKTLLWGMDEDDCLWAVEQGSNRLTKLDWNSSLVESKGFQNNKLVGNSPKTIEYTVNVDPPETLVRTVFPFFEQNYTRAVSEIVFKDQSNKGVDLSWCGSDYRVPLTPKLREILPESIPSIVSARNDFESFQIVVHTGDAPLKNLKASMSKTLSGENGASVPDENVSLRYAYYHYVDRPTDSTCAIGWYPDALVPFEQGSDGLGAPIDVDSNRNFIVWVTVHVAEDAPAGKYRGAVRITADEGSFEATCPFELNVCDFSLPLRNTLETAYGLSYDVINRYHNLKSEKDKRIVYEKYLKIFSDYRISTYNPVPLDPIEIEWRPGDNPPQCNLDFSRFDVEIKRVFEKYHFTNFKLPVLGLGGGNYQGRYEGSIEGFKAGSPEYQAMFSDYVQKLQEHLKALGLLNAAYIYSFDEPEEKDYEFVAGEFAKIKKYAPDLNIMLTEEPSKGFEEILSAKSSSIDIWCPVSPNYSDESAKPEREQNHRFWWYVCCFPKAPYCTEFTDHAALELRLWHWQAFERNIAGCLVWTSNYWTSSTAFPDSYQNPYEDPACFVSDGSLPKGSKVLWGNGDGRFVYPPLSAAVPGRNNGEPIYDDPCASIRWEMIREGVEDYEMLVILKNLLEEKGRDLSVSERRYYEKLFDFGELTESMTRFTNDPQVLRQRRQEVMNAIVELRDK